MLLSQSMKYQLTFRSYLGDPASVPKGQYVTMGNYTA